jgi:hypothetical protein
LAVLLLTNQDKFIKFNRFLILQNFIEVNPKLRRKMKIRDGENASRSSEINVFSDGRGGFSFRPVGEHLIDFYPSDEVEAVGIHPCRCSRYTGESLASEPMTDISGRKISSPFSSFR